MMMVMIVIMVVMITKVIVMINKMIGMMTMIILQQKDDETGSTHDPPYCSSRASLSFVPLAHSGTLCFFFSSLSSSSVPDSSSDDSLQVKG